jgi:hypothetical protein
MKDELIFKLKEEKHFEVIDELNGKGKVMEINVKKYESEISYAPFYNYTNRKKELYLSTLKSSESETSFFTPETPGLSEFQGSISYHTETFMDEYVDKKMELNERENKIIIK